MSAPEDPFTRLAFERERTQYVLHGYRFEETGETGGFYYKQAHSLREAMATRFPRLRSMMMTTTTTARTRERARDRPGSDARARE